MNPALQTQIFDVLRQQWVQADGGELAMAALLFQTLVELRLLNAQIQAQNLAQPLTDSLDVLRADLLNEINFTRLG